MKKPIFFLMSCLGWLSTIGQIGRIEGHVKDTLNGPVFGLGIYLEGTNFGSFSNPSGAFRIENIPAGNYRMVISGLGFDLKKMDLAIVSNETLKLEIQMKESVSNISEAIVMAKGISGLKENPGSLQVISSKELQRFSYSDVQRALRSVPGINIQEEDGFGLRPNIGLRGTGVERSSKITIMEDGILSAPAPYADPAAYYFPTVGRISAIEVLKGSSQIKYGPFTTGGAINLISTQIPEGFSGGFQIFAGNFGTKNLHLIGGASGKNAGFLVETFQYGSEGFKNLDGGGSTGFEKKDFLAKIRVNTNPTAKVFQSLNLKAGQAFESSAETYLGLTELDFEKTPFRKYAGSAKDHMETDQSQLSVSHLIKFSAAFKIITSIYRNNFGRNWYKLDKVKDSTGTIFNIAAILDNPEKNALGYSAITGNLGNYPNTIYIRANNRNYYSQGAQTLLHLTFNQGNLNHNIQFGIRYHEDEADRFQWDDEFSMKNGLMLQTKAGIPGTESNRIKGASAWSGFLQYYLRFKKLTVVPGFRYEDIFIHESDYGKADVSRIGKSLVLNSNRVNVFIPGLGIDFKFNDFLSSFAGVHKGFSPPGPKDDTQPEESVNYELGIRFARNAHSGQVVLFFNDYQNLLGSDLAAAGGTGSGDLFNAGSSEAKGIEFLYSLNLLSSTSAKEISLPLTITYTYSNAVFKNDFVSSFEDWGTVKKNDKLPYLAQNQGSIMVGIDHRKFELSFNLRYSDAMRTKPGQGPVLSKEKTDGYLILDGGGSFHINKNFTFFMNGLNLTNEGYVVARRPAGLRPGLPFSYNIGVKGKF